MAKSSAQRQSEYVTRMRALGLTQVKVWVGPGDEARADLKEIERREIERASVQAAETQGQLKMFDSGDSPESAAGPRGRGAAATS